MVAAFRADEEVLYKVFFIKNLFTTRALNPQSFGHTIWNGRCRYRATCFLKPSHPSNLTYSWDVVSGASTHVLYLFDEFIKFFICPLEVQF